MHSNSPMPAHCRDFPDTGFLQKGSPGATGLAHGAPVALDSAPKLRYHHDGGLIPRVVRRSEMIGHGS